MTFSTLDFTAFFGYFVIVAIVAVVVSRKEKVAADYFLAGRNLPWWLIGMSLIASNISTEQLVGQAGQGASYGLAVAAYGPNRVTAKLGEDGLPVAIEQTTDYPFKARVRLTVTTGKPAAFPLELRIPDWCGKPAFGEKQFFFDAAVFFFRVGIFFSSAEAYRVRRR